MIERNILELTVAEHESSNMAEFSDRELAYGAKLLCLKTDNRQIAKSHETGT